MQPLLFSSLLLDLRCKDVRIKSVSNVIDGSEWPTRAHEIIHHSMNRTLGCVDDIGSAFIDVS